ncbi:hypothetical protein LCGC14_2784620, partial [marine sediment metagenome]
LMPGEKYAGTTVMPQPYEVLTVPHHDWPRIQGGLDEERYQYHCLMANPLHSSGRGWAEAVLIKEASAIQAAFKYWIARPTFGWIIPPGSSAAAARAHLAASIIYGDTSPDERHDYDHVARYVFSERAKVRVPLKTPVEMYME